MKKQGDYTNGMYEIQPNRQISEKNDGTLEGSVIYKTDRERFNLLPQLDSTHPDDSRLECYQRNITYSNNGEVILTASYFGLTSSKTDPVVAFTGGQNNDPIETHPDFIEFAGDASLNKEGSEDPLMDEITTVNEDGDIVGTGILMGENGARFDKETREFLGFYTGEFMGTTHYLTPSTMISLSYWTSRKPTIKKRLSIVNKITGVSTPSDVKNFLLLDSPYRQVGNFYQVTEQYLGSGPKGWNKTIYSG